MALDPKKTQQPLRKLRKLLKKMPAEPAPEQVHALRTQSRRIEATLQALSLDSRQKTRRLLKEICKLRKRAGKVRDMDVLTDSLSRLRRDDSESECFVRLIEHLGAQRQKHAEKLHALKQQYEWEMRKGLNRTSRRIEKMLPRSANRKSDADSVSTAVAASVLKLSSELKLPPRLHRTNLHEYRLKVKELRNVLQMAENSDQQGFVESLGEVKDAIGEWHDWEELVAIAKEVLDHGSNCQLQRQLCKIADGRYRNALELSQRMRKKFLHVSDGNRSSRNKVHRFPEPVCSAASALAA
jgi:CHAD domain-containing protein